MFFNIKKKYVILVNKPIYWTSFDIIKKIKITFNLKKIGHAGTLDPLAIGLLLIFFGRKTKSIKYYQNLNKLYECKIIIGNNTKSFDLGTKFYKYWNFTNFKEKKKYFFLKKIGYIYQTPPIYSAVKVKGKRAYQEARIGKLIKLLPKKIYLKFFKFKSLNFIKIKFKIICGKGVYIRSFVWNFGNFLNKKTCLLLLKRKKVGNYNIKNSYNVF